MPISHVIAHHLRADGQSEANLSLREEGLPIEGHSEVLLSQLKSSFLGRISREHGAFRTEGSPPLLARELDAFLDGQRSWPEVSVTLMKQLKHLADERRLEIDAHSLFFVEQSFDHHVFYWFVANLSEALTISETLDVVPSHSIDTGSSLFGIKVDLEEWRGRGHYAYLSLLRPRGQQPLADAFVEVTGFSNGLDKEKATLAFLEGVEAFSEQVPQEQVNDYRIKVVEHCLERDEMDAPVELQGLAKALDGVDSEAFVRVMSGHMPEGEQEVMMDRRCLRRYVKFAGREKDLAISFSSHQLNERIHYDPETDTLSIHGIPRALRDQLLGHLKAT